MHQFVEKVAVLALKERDTCTRMDNLCLKKKHKRTLFFQVYTFPPLTFFILFPLVRSNCSKVDLGEEVHVVTGYIDQSYLPESVQISRALFSLYQSFGKSDDAYSGSRVFNLAKLEVQMRIRTQKINVSGKLKAII